MLFVIRTRLSSLMSTFKSLYCNPMLMLVLIFFWVFWSLSCTQDWWLPPVEFPFIYGSMKSFTWESSPPFKGAWLGFGCNMSFMYLINKLCKPIHLISPFGEVFHLIAFDLLSVLYLYLCSICDLPLQKEAIPSQSYLLSYRTWYKVIRFNFI